MDVHIFTYLWEITLLFKFMSSLLLSSVRSQRLFSVSKIKIFHFAICLKTLFSLSFLWLSKIREDRLQSVEFLASKFILEKKSKQGSDPIISISSMDESKSRNVDIFLSFSLENESGPSSHCYLSLLQLKFYNCSIRQPVD